MSEFEFPVGTGPAIYSGRERIVLVLYYFCWVFGTKFDVTMQKLVYVVDPAKSYLRIGSVAMVVLLPAVAIILLWARGDEKKFAAAFSAFLIVNPGC
jgi:hypothetical protein